MNDEHPISKSVRESKERARAIVSQIFAKETPNAEDLHHLAVQYIATEAVGKASKVRASTGLYFEHPAAIDPPPHDDESFLIVFETVDEIIEDGIAYATWDRHIQCWLANDRIVPTIQVSAILRIPTELSELQRVTVDTNREILEEEDAESEGGG